MKVGARKLAFSLQPAGYVPIPIHTEPYDFDHILNAQAICPRYFALREFIKSCPEVQAAFRDSKVGDDADRIASFNARASGNNRFIEQNNQIIRRLIQHLSGERERREVSVCALLIAISKK